MSTNTNVVIEFDAVSRHYGSVKAVDHVSFTIQQGEFFSMLGPSGSGKTTCLRLIAGFEHPSSGKVKLSGIDVSCTPPYERNVNTVFQDYALFPHLSVIENIEYGLRAKKTNKKEARRLAMEALEMVDLSNYSERRPSQLSGGQRQRVALARAIVNRPPVMLLDEPLGALDLRLREQMQVELKKLHRQLGITFVYVTHDQKEALSMSDRVAVFSNGQIEQVDTPQGLYQSPVTEFVAKFVGGSNILRNDLSVMSGNTQHTLMSVRPEHIQVQAYDQTIPTDHTSLRGILVDIQYQGASSRYEVDVNGQIVVADIPAHIALNNVLVGSSVKISWLTNNTIYLKH